MKNTNRGLRRLNPAISRRGRLALAGLMWTGVGAMLCSYALTWLTHPLVWLAVPLALLGLAISVVANRVQFARLAEKNMERILRSPQRACVFSFLAWKSYAIIAVMMTAGIMLRNSAIPRPYLAVIYTAIGGALLQASTRYYLHLLRERSAQAEAMTLRQATE